MAKFLINPITGKLDLSLNKAAEIKYDNTTSGLSATDVQAAIDEVVAEEAAPEVEYRTITAPEAAAKQLTLATTPIDSAKVILAVSGGGSQMLGPDFTVSGTTLSWNGLALDGILNSGDQIYITYAI
jgi:hypothetical protein